MCEIHVSGCQLASMVVRRKRGRCCESLGPSDQRILRDVARIVVIDEAVGKCRPIGGNGQPEKHKQRIVLEGVRVRMRKPTGERLGSEIEPCATLTLSP